MDSKPHTMSDSDESDHDGCYIPLHQRLGASKGSAGSCVDPISLDSSENEADGSSPPRPSPDREKVSRPVFSAFRASPPNTNTFPSSTVSSPPSPLSSQHSASPPSSPPRPPFLPPPRTAAGSRPPRAAGGSSTTAEAKLQRQREREEAKRQKELEKRLRQAETAAKRSVRPEHCQKTLHVLVDRHVLEVEGGGQVLAALQATDVTVHVTTAAHPGTVTWERDVTSWGEDDGQIVTRATRQPEDQIVAVFATESLASLVEEQMAAPSRGLTGVMRELGLSTGKKVTVLCWGLDKYCRTKTLAGSYRPADGAENGGKRRKRAAPKLDRLELEAVIVGTMLDTPHNLRLVNAPTDGGDFLAQMSKAIAEAPFKRQRGGQQFSWFADADSARPVKVDRQLRGLRRLWSDQLRQLPGGSLEAAQAVTGVYPSPQALVKAYAACSSERECEALVADLPVRRTVGPLVSSRRVGNEMSRKLYLAMSSTDGTTEL